VQNTLYVLSAVEVKGQGWRQFADSSRFQNRRCIKTSARRRVWARVCACLISVSDASQKEENEFALNRERAVVEEVLNLRT